MVGVKADERERANVLILPIKYYLPKGVIPFRRRDKIRKLRKPTLDTVNGSNGHPCMKF